jgi:two-component sensor histidine kinase
MSNDTIDRADAPVDPAALVDAMEGDRFKQFLDHVPVAVAVSELQPSEIVTYANLEFQRLTGRSGADIEGKSWRTLPGVAAADGDERLLRDAVRDDAEYIGVFSIQREAGPIDVDVWSNTIESDAGEPLYRLVAMAAAIGPGEDDEAAPGNDKDLQLKELQHRVKNNLQMITALIRLEARNLPDRDNIEGYDRLAGRINALAVLYEALSRDHADNQVDLGAYLGQIAAAIMQAHAVEGIRLDTRIDTWPVSVDVAMPAGLVVNEVLTNALKHAFVGRDQGVIKLHSLIDDVGCHITVADNGIGLPVDMGWPRPGTLSALMVKSLQQNASAKLSVKSTPDKGVTVVISFARSDAG